MANRKWQDWTNRNLFTTSVESAAGEVPSSLHSSTAAHKQPTEGSATELKATSHEHGGVPAKKADVSASSAVDPHATGSSKSITALQAAWNVTNAIQGMFIVGLPFAVKIGGWWAVFALVGVAYVCYRTGLSLIDCLYDENGIKVRWSYKDVAESVRPGLGKWVLVAQLTELISTCILYLVLAGDLLQGCFPGIEHAGSQIMLVTATLLGVALLDDIRIVSHLSLANAVSHLVINAIMVLYCFGQMGSWSIASVPILPRFHQLPTVLGVVVFGYTSHIFLPSLEASMEDPKEFEWMLNRSHLAAALFKSIFGLIGFLTFAEFTQKEISNSLPNQLFKVVINLVLLLKALLSYPLPYYAAAQLLTENLFRGTKHTLFTSCYGKDATLREWAVCLRILLVFTTLFIALSAPYLIELMGLVGSITGTMLSFIWPAYFHLRLKGGSLSEKEAKFNRMVIWMGVGVCVIGVYYSSLELLHAVQEAKALAAETD